MGKRSVDERLRHRAEIARLKNLGWINQDIATYLGISPATVSKDWKALKQEWADSALVDTNSVQQSLLLQLHWVIQEAAEAWENSKEQQETVTKSGGEGKPSSVTIKRVSKDPDAAYLRVIESAAEKVAKIAGLYNESAQVTVNNYSDPRELTDEQLAAIASGNA